ncbi:tRNA (N6-threonylcarbamoyladenosine(37)-N6)-methyltransferase TrmO [Candidatus Sumerlaeota bacterium]
MSNARLESGEMPGDITLRPIGVIHSPHQQPSQTPIQPVYAKGIEGTAEIFAQYAQGLRDLEGFSHIFLLYHFHRAAAAKLIVTPFLEDVEHGVFCTRAPCRPNPLGLSLVRLVRREGRLLRLQDMDILDGTPLLDIKPYVTRFDVRRQAVCGWQDSVDEEVARKRGSRADGQ